MDESRRSSMINNNDIISECEQKRISYETMVQQNPHNSQAVHYLAMWHLERHSFHQAREYFQSLTTLRSNDVGVWMSYSICCAMDEKFDECQDSLQQLASLIEIPAEDVRLAYGQALLSEKKKDFPEALNGYVCCLKLCPFDSLSVSPFIQNIDSNEQNKDKDRDNVISKNETTSSGSIEKTKSRRDSQFAYEMRGEILIRIAMVKKEMGNLDEAMDLCNNILSERYGHSIRGNAHCLMGMLHEMKSEYQPAELSYRSALQQIPGHTISLERLGRVYIRYRETIPAAVQCFFKAVATNPSNSTAWYLLGRCYMATAQYMDACEAFNRSINLNANEPQVWCSLGVLYYAFGQYKEALGMIARALKLDNTMADAWYNVGALYDICDQPEDAQQAYIKARELGITSTFDRVGMLSNPISGPSTRSSHDTKSIANYNRQSMTRSSSSIDPASSSFDVAKVSPLEASSHVFSSSESLSNNPLEVSNSLVNESDRFKAINEERIVPERSVYFGGNELGMSESSLQEPMPSMETLSSKISFPIDQELPGQLSAMIESSSSSKDYKKQQNDKKKLKRKMNS